MDINEAFETTFKIIFGECNVKLDELGPYLLKYHYPPIHRKSSVSGKNVVFSNDSYCKDAKIISQDEIDFKKKFEPLNANEVKDIDSIVEALGDRFCYAGNKMFGNSKFVEGGDACFDSFHVKDSHNISASKYIAYSSYLRDGTEFAFGSSFALKVRYLIHSSTMVDASRCFETYFASNCSDLFFTYNCFGCAHAMFSFNLRSKRYCIGNLELPKEKYFTIRKKLIDESREYLEKNKSFHSIFELPLSKPNLEKMAVKSMGSADKGNMEPIESAFRGASRIIFGKEIGSVRDYENYLTRSQDKIEKVKTALGNEVYRATLFFYRNIPKFREVNSGEALELGKLKLEETGLDTLEKIIKNLDKIAFYRADYYEGDNHNIIESPMALDSMNAYKSRSASYTKNSAYTTMAHNSEAMFGCYRALYSKFCINCNHSLNLSGCFEMDGCSNCLNSMFCHNCEGLDNCMFCFNVKSKRYAIGNVEIGREKYMEIKKKIMDEIVPKLEKNKKFDLSIYNIGCRQM